MVWRGNGWLAIVILVGGLYLLPAAWLYLHGERNLPSLWVVHYDRVFAWSLMLLGGLLLWLGRRWNRNPDRMVRNARTGAMVRAGVQHSAYYVAVEWWGVAAIIGGFLMLLRAKA